MEPEETVLYEVRDGIAYITMNRPERHNATRHREYELLGEYARKADLDDNVRAVIWSGRGKSFSVSDDIQGLKSDDGLSPTSEDLFQHFVDQDWANWVAKGESVNPAQNMARVMLESGKIFIAAVQGLCILTELTYPCDFVIAADDARFTQPDIVIGQVSSGSGTVVLPRLLGRRRALEMFLDPTPISAEEAYRRGIVNKVVPLPDLMAEAEALARKLIVYNPKTVGIIKKLITRSQGPVDEFLKMEQLYCGYCHGMPGTGAPIGNWVDLLGYPKELLEGLDMSVPYAWRAADEKK
jgi:enoyl-CoA hydratase/carnithine racemase